MKAAMSKEVRELISIPEGRQALREAMQATIKDRLQVIDIEVNSKKYSFKRCEPVWVFNHV